jgi:hypothetical protein
MTRTYYPLFLQIYALESAEEERKQMKPEEKPRNTKQRHTNVEFGKARVFVNNASIRNGPYASSS